MNRFSFVISALVAVACTNTTGPLENLGGTWEGYYISAINGLHVTLLQRGDSVAGTAIYAPDDWSYQRLDTLTVTGTFSRPTAKLDFTPFGNTTFHFSGTVIGTRLSGDDGMGDSMYFQKR